MEGGTKKMKKEQDNPVDRIQGNPYATGPTSPLGGKKMKKEDVEQVDEALPALALGAAKMMLGTKAGLATTGYMLGKSVQKKSMQDRQREVSGGVSDSVEHDDDSVEEDMTIFGMDREKYAKLSDQEKRTIRTSYRAKRDVSK